MLSNTRVYFTELDLKDDNRQKRKCDVDDLVVVVIVVVVLAVQVVMVAVVMVVVVMAVQVVSVKVMTASDDDGWLIE